MKRPAKDRLKQFLDGSPEDPHELPLVHTTSAYNFDRICQGKVIEPSHCDVFNKKLTYLFYARPAYRTEASLGKNLKFHWPFAFIIDPNVISSIDAIYPFDTGAFALNLYNGFFSKESELADFRLPGDLSYARRVVGRFYDDSTSYILGRVPKHEDLPIGEFEAQGLQSLAQYPQSATLDTNAPPRDERSTSIEIQTAHEIDIPAATRALIVPEPWVAESRFVNAVKNWGIQSLVHTYELAADSESANWVPDVRRKATEIYRDLGLI